MIVRDAGPLSATEVARRLGVAPAPCWFCTPGAGDLAVERQYVACDPVEIVRAESAAGLSHLTQAWHRARERWATHQPQTPVAAGYLSYDLAATGASHLFPSEARRTGASHLFRSEAGRTGARHLGGAGAGLEFRFYDAVWVGQRGRGCIWAASVEAAERMERRLRDGAAAATRGGASFELGPLLPIEPPAQHLEAILRVKEYLRAGDAYQVNLARRLKAEMRSTGPTGLALFQRLSEQSAAPHAFWMADHEREEALVGNSPERFLRVTLSDAGRIVETAPIKGTRPRGRTPELEDAAVADLRSNPKDRAEHVMIVDLERNDLGRVCETGSVEVLDPLRVLTLPSVHHLVSTIRGRLRDEVDLTGLVNACFPGGSITGAPKLRAMEIIEELEPAPRGVYTGATGWLGAAGDLDLAIAIRTAAIRDDTLTLWVGGGIVIDSSPEAELEETIVKARAFSGLTGSGG